MTSNNSLGKSTVNQLTVNKARTTYKWKAIDPESIMTLIKEEGMLDVEGNVDCKGIVIVLMKIANLKVIANPNSEILRVISITI